MAQYEQHTPERATSAQPIADQVTSWPGVSAHDHRFGGIEFRVGDRQLGHLHGDRIADIPLKRSLRDELVAPRRSGQRATSGRLRIASSCRAMAATT